MNAVEKYFDILYETTDLCEGEVIYELLKILTKTQQDKIMKIFDERYKLNKYMGDDQ